MTFSKLIVTTAASAIIGASAVLAQEAEQPAQQLGPQAQGGNVATQCLAIPWEGLKATPGMSFFVLDVDENVVEQAPWIDPDLFARPDVFERQRQEVDEYWQHHMAT